MILFSFLSSLSSFCVLSLLTTDGAESDCPNINNPSVGSVYDISELPDLSELSDLISFFLPKPLASTVIGQSAPHSSVLGGVELSSPQPGDGATMSYHTGRTSPEQKSLDGRSTISTTQINEKPIGLSRTLQNLLIAPQSKSAGGTTYSPRGGTRSPVEPLVSSPLRISSSDMASAPNSPERPTASREALPRRSSDHVVDTVRSTTGLDIDDAKSDIASTSLEQPHVKKRFLQARDKSQSRKGVAAIMSGRLFPRSFARGRDRDSSRGSSQRGSSLDSHATSSPERGRPSSSGSHSVHVETLTPAPSNPGKGKSLNMNDTFNRSDEVLTKPHGSLPDYIKPTAVEEGGERIAKDVFDSDKNMIESSEDEANDTSSDEDSTLEGVRGRKKKKDSDITSITPSDFEKSKDDDSKQPEERMLFCPGASII